MTKLKLVTYILLFINLGVYSQTNNASITYNVQLKKDNALYQKKDRYFLGAMQAAKGLKFKLLYKDGKALFEDIEALRSDEFKTKIAKTFAGYINPIYNDYDALKSYNYPKDTPIFKSKKFLIERSLDFDWKLLQESKVIKGYRCFKAILKEPEEGTYQTIAWYCPDINLPTGPLFYGNLPGLIIELTNKYATFYLNSLEINQNENLEIQFPTKGKRISKPEYRQQFKAKMDSLQTRFKK